MHITVAFQPARDLVVGDTVTVNLKVRSFGARPENIGGLGVRNKGAHQPCREIAVRGGRGVLGV